MDYEITNNRKECDLIYEYLPSPTIDKTSDYIGFVHLVTDRWSSVN